MKLINVLLGVFFGLWATGTIVLGIADLSAPLLSRAGLTDAAATLGAATMLGLVSVWSFQIALKKPSQPVPA